MVPEIRVVRDSVVVREITELRLRSEVKLLLARGKLLLPAVEPPLLSEGTVPVVEGKL